MAYIFTKKEVRKPVKLTQIRCGRHYAIVYKHPGLSGWNYRVGFHSPALDFIPADQHSFGSAATKSAAIVQAEAAIVGHGPNGVDYLDCSIEYWTEEKYQEAFGNA